MSVTSETRYEMEMPCGYVEVCYHPTEYDKIGCDGMYVKKVRLKPFSQWPIGWKAKVLCYTTISYVGNCYEKLRNMHSKKQKGEG